MTAIPAYPAAQFGVVVSKMDTGVRTLRCLGGLHPLNAGGVFAKLRRIAPHFQTALVTGESGAGKKSAAKALHQLSPSAAKSFVVCNCAAISESLFESELFGHVRGAFTGATQDKHGLVEAASGGTLFLDEITGVPFDERVTAKTDA